MSVPALNARKATAIAPHQGGWFAGVRIGGHSAVGVHKGFARRPLGEIMVAMGLIDGRSRDVVLERQQAMALPFGECCRRLKLIDAEGLSKALAWQFGYVYPAFGSTQFTKDLVMVSDPFGAYADAMRSVASRLMSRWIGAGSNALAVTSAEPGEGRSHVAANLAVSFAQAGYMTLLIDADLRKPKQHIIFGVSQHPGLSRLLCGFAPEDVVNRIGQFRNLAVITSGPRPPNPSELLGRNELAVLMTQAKECYDVVLVDTPAATSFSDAESIALAAGGALLVVRKSRTRQAKLRGLAESLADNGVEVVGTVMNIH
jgi:protein-tyrosine kinase